MIYLRKNRKKIGKIIFLSAFGLSVVFYFVDSIIDAVFFGEGTISKQLLHPDGVEIWIRSFTAFLLFLFAFFINIAVKNIRNASKKTEESRKFFEYLVEKSSAVTWERAVGEEDYTYISPNCYNLFGFCSEEAKEKNFFKSCIHPEDTERVTEKREKHFKNGGDCEMTYRVFKKDGTFLWIREIIHSVVNLEGKDRVLGIIYDVTADKEKEKELSEALKEKTVLMRELQHRSKNNMQMISSLINLTAWEKRDIKSILKDLQNRIRSISILHELLYRKGSVANLDVSNYIERLVFFLRDSFIAGSSRVVIEKEVDIPPVGIDLLVVCGLLINELVSNSLKYAFQDREDGVVWVSLTAKNGVATLTVRDNGLGFSEENKPQNSPHIGLEIVTALVRQINGEVTVKKENGTTSTITFNLDQ